MAPERAARLLEVENQRIESILLSKAGLDNLPMAKQIAFESNLSSEEGISLLNRAQGPGMSSGEYIYRQEARRIELILNSPAGLSNVDMAKHVALNTSLNPKDAIHFLKSKVQQDRASLFMEAMSYVENPDVGAGGGEDFSDEHQATMLARRAVAMIE